ncbi:MAG: aspartate dehydrogenase [bacterium]
MKGIKVGLIGCGTIGARLAEAITYEVEGMELAAVNDIIETRARDLAGRLSSQIKIKSLEEIADEVDLVVEAASAQVVPEVVSAAISRKKAALIMSTGGLLERLDLVESARDQGVPIFIPSGAMAGLDAVKAAGRGRISSVCLKTSKPPAGLKGAPWVVEKGIDLDNIGQPKVIFQGNALEAARHFPANINVAATLSLAGIGADQTKVEIVADPNLRRNVHEIQVEGDFGRIISRCENLPAPSNPKTSYLAVLSAIAVLRGITDSVRVGT